MIDSTCLFNQERFNLLICCSLPFFVPASTVYRMAVVQLKRCRVIRKCSIDKQLNPYIHHQLEKYIHDCKVDRKTYASMPKGNNRFATMKSPGYGGKVAIGSLPYASLHKSDHKSPTGRSLENTENEVGILDPVSNTVVAQYSSLATAGEALLIMFKDIGQTVRPFSDAYMKTIFRACLKNASSTIFGYRWLRIKDIQNQNLATNYSINYKAAQDFSVRIPGSYAIIHKVHTITGVTMATFNSMSSAFSDWATVSQLTDVGLFKKNYIHGNCRIQNYVWKSELPGVELTNPYIQTNCLLPPYIRNRTGTCIPVSNRKKGIAAESKREQTQGKTHTQPKVYMDAMHAAGNYNNLAMPSRGDQKRSFNGDEMNIKQNQYASASLDPIPPTVGQVAPSTSKLPGHPTSSYL